MTITRKITNFAMAAALLLAATPVSSVSAALTAQPYQKIVFDRWFGSSNAEIVLRNLDGSNEKVLYTSATGSAYKPVYSMDGKKVYFQADVDASPSVDAWDIFSINVDGTGLTNLTNTPTIDELQPTTNAANTDVIFTAYDGASEYYVLKLAPSGDFSTADIILQEMANLGRSRYTADGAKIVYQQGSAPTHVYIANSDGTNVVQLSTATDAEGAAEPRVAHTGGSYKIYWETTGGYSSREVNLNTSSPLSAVQSFTSSNSIYDYKKDTSNSEITMYKDNANNKMHYSTVIGDAVINKVSGSVAEEIFNASFDYTTPVTTSAATNAAGGDDITLSTDQTTYDFEVHQRDTLVVTETGTIGDAVVNSGATLKGKGNVGNVSVLAGGKAAPGLSPGCLTSSGTVTLSGALDVEIGGTTVCTQYDQLVATAVNLTGATLTVSQFGGFTPAGGQVYQIVRTTTGNVTGTFTGLAEGATLIQGGVSYRVNYTTKAVTLTVLGATTTPTTTGAPNTGLKPSIMGSSRFIVASFVVAVALLVVRRKLVRS